MSLAPSPFRGARLRPGTTGFTIVLSLSMAVTALAIDSILPAFADIRAHYGLADDSTAVAGLVTTFLLGSGLGLLPAGLLADRFGRRPVMWGGLALYVVGAVGAALAPSLAVMLFARFVWGLGSAGPRVAALAMVRDAYEGAQMARQMSFIMAVFLIVPTLAPTLGAGLVALGSWQLVVWMCALAGLVVFGLTTRLPATLPLARRQPFSARVVWRSCRVVVTTPGTIGYLAAMTAMFGAFISYLASSEIIVDEVFGLDVWFPAIFGGLAVAMGVAMVANGRLVERVGLERMLGGLLVVQLVADVVFLVAVVATGGTPPFWLFITIFVVVLGCQQAVTPNLNSAAMRPLGEVAGTAAAILGMVPMVFGSILGSVIDRAFDGTVTPLALGFLGAGVCSLVATRWALRVGPSGSPQPPVAAASETADAGHLQTGSGTP
jgi:DHA1 family bicyclomycin/chloramphenicol resistance-like MFS transporter